ncbi:amidohydrolase, partial [bacterium]
IKNMPPKSRVFINGNILTMDENNTVAEAVALRRDKIVAVGTNEKIKKLIKAGTKVVDLEGKTLIPGFVDAHSHFPAGGLSAVAVDVNSPPIGDIKNISELISAMKKKADKTKKGKWILGYGYDDTVLEEMRHPTRYDLDKVSTEHPIVIAHISWHVTAVNSLALELLGIDKNTENPEGGVIQRDPETGEPNGVLEENAGEDAYREALHFSLPEQLAITMRGVKKYASAGITTAQNGLTDKEMLMPLAAASRVGLIPFRLEMWPGADVWDKVLAGKMKKDKYDTEKLRMGVVKLFADGSIQARTGYLREPYHTPGPDGDETFRGYPIQSREKLAEMVTKYHGAGLQMAIHGNGDAAIDDIIYAVSKAQEAHPREDPRHILIHGQMTRPDQLDEFKRLGITPSYHAVHPFYWGDRHHYIFMGTERASRISPMKTTIEKGVRFSIHTDAPVVPQDQLFLVWCAVNRITSGGRVIGKAERITPMQALRAVTIDSAWQVFQEDNRGSVEPYKYADLVILSDNPIENPETIRDIKVLETIVGGKTIYKEGIH